MELRDNSMRARQAIGIFQLMAVLSVLTILADFWYISQLAGGLSTGDIDNTWPGIVHNLLSLSELLMLVASLVFFIRWQRRAYWNLHFLQQRLDHSEGWAAGAWFVPFINIYRPYSIMREVWRRTQLLATEQVMPHGLLRAWWVLFLLQGFASNINGRMAGAARTTLDLENAAWANIIAAALSVATALLTIRMVQRTAEFEEQLAWRQQVSRIGAAPLGAIAELEGEQSDFEY